MKESAWYLIKHYLDNHSHEDVFKGILSHICDITDNKMLEVIYLEYLDSDYITNLISEDIIELIKKLEDK
ncbi:hypothetical protein [Staphylococcus agnetis]|uniref:hypothetical protein n=1 Tax=Staphylococcus agnetis TaxID=985762 RepID=UPI000D02C853|nr:hypothetical protein [Staphylococcus agnetis]